jgi:hypothetical protein
MMLAWNCEIARPEIIAFTMIMEPTYVGFSIGRVVGCKAYGKQAVQDATRTGDVSMYYTRRNYNSISCCSRVRLTPLYLDEVDSHYLWASWSWKKVTTFQSFLYRLCHQNRLYVDNLPTKIIYKSRGELKMQPQCASTTKKAITTLLLKVSE